MAYRFRACCVHHNVISDPVENQIFSFLWPETIAKKGVNECISCLDHLIRSRKKKEQRILILATDNCAGNYHNRITISYLVWLIARKELDMFVLHSKIRGHTYFSTNRASGPFKRDYDRSNVYSTGDIAKI